MKRIYLLVAGLICILSVDAEHWMGITADFHSPIPIDNIAITSPRIGYGGMLGGEYQYQHRHFTLETGIMAAYSCANLSVESEQLSFPMRDTQGKEFNYEGDLRNRKENFSSFNIQIPLFLGAEFNHVYVLVGAKAVYSIKGHSSLKAELATVGQYDRYYDELTDMPNHGFHDYQRVSNKYTLGSGLDVRICAEVGGVWHTRTMKGRVGAFCEYGVLNQISSTSIFRAGGASSSQPMTEADVSQYMNVTMNPVYSSSVANGCRFNNLVVGVRLSLLFPLRSSTKYDCRCMNQ